MCPRNKFTPHSFPVRVPCPHFPVASSLSPVCCPQFPAPQFPAPVPRPQFPVPCPPVPCLSSLPPGPCPQFPVPSSLSPVCCPRFPAQVPCPSSLPPAQCWCPSSSFRKRTKLLISDRADLRRSIEKKQPPCSMLMSQLKLPKKRNETADLRQS